MVIRMQRICTAIATVALFLNSAVWTSAQSDDDFFKQDKKPILPKKAKSADDLISFKVDVEPKEVRRGETAKVSVTAIPVAGAYTYPLTQRVGDQTVLKDVVFEAPHGLKPLWPIAETEPELVYDPVDKRDILKHKKPVTWSRDVLVLSDATPGMKAVRITTDGFQVCNDNNCFPKKYDFTADIKVSDAPAVALTPELEERLKADRPPVKVIGPSVPAVSPKNERPPSVEPANAEKPRGVSVLPIDESAAEYRTALEKIQKQIEADKKPTTPVGLLAFMLQGVFWGAVSLITPCVFPMIPITVSFFLKQSEKQHYKPITMAVVYCVTIVTVLTISAIALLSAFRTLSVHPTMNFALGALFVFFALSLFGMYDIELPSSLTRFTSAREGKGGLLGVMFMALTFTIVSFACVAPFLGGFGGTAGSSAITWGHRVLGGLAFSVTFAAPFFVLALFPTLLQRLPKSGSWLNSVKVVMGFLELAAALKFFRQAELNFSNTPEFFTYDLVLGLWIAIALLCGLYLLNLYRLPHDGPIESIGVPRLFFGLIFIGLGFYLLPAMFRYGTTGEKQRPAGTIYAWVDSFLLPDQAAPNEAYAWNANLPRAIAEARAESKRTGEPRYVFVDFTGETCVNCKFNESTVFSKGQFQKLFERYSLVQMYTDKVPNHFYSSRLQGNFGKNVDRQKQDAELNLQFQRDTFGTEQLPLYVILRPLPDGDGIEEVARYDEGKINNESEFAQFLRKPFEESAARADASSHR
jgi:thiol:disulfide interchange protein DsbD